MLADLPPATELATAVRSGEWAEVRTLTAALPRPLPAPVALVAARAARLTGDANTALAHLRAALPTAGELAAALRLEAAEILLARGEDPWPYLAPLLRPGVPAAHRQAAGERLRRAFATLPLPQLQRYRERTLPAPLERARAAAVAVRSSDPAAATRFLRQHRQGREAVEVARWLAAEAGVAVSAQLLAAEVLLGGGLWREADALLQRLPLPLEAGRGGQAAFLRGRAAYRLGRLDEADRHLETALAAAADPQARFAAAVQRARIAEIRGHWPAAAELWAEARAAGPAEVEGWDGGARLLVALGRGGAVPALLRQAPPAVRRVAGPRAAAALLARGDAATARALLRTLPEGVPAVRFLTVVAAVAAGERGVAARRAVALVADPGAGAYRDLALELLPPTAPPGGEPPASHALATLALTALQHGPDAARRQLEAALASDLAWAPLLAGPAPRPVGWDGPAAALAAVGLEGEAATLYPHRFPTATPTELAWSAATLAAWGNGPAALTCGERLWAALGGVPATLLPESLLPHILPAPLTSQLATAAAAAGTDPAWLAAIVRRESRFDTTARSPAGALGIAQIVPETARRLGVAPEALGDAQVGLQLAASEVARLARCFPGRLDLVAAGYNAGEAVVASWLRLLGEPPAPLFVAAIPYRETADYVLAVVEGARLARHLLARTTAITGGSSAPPPPGPPAPRSTAPPPP